MASAQVNKLEQFATVNCLFTLAAVTPGEANSQSYRSANPLPRVIFASAGRFDKDRIQTAYGAPEYFIDNVRFDTVIAPTPNKGTGPWMKLEFDIYEPYSMGLFLQSCQAAAVDAGFNTYLDNCPYVLRLEFKGWSGPNESLSYGPYNWLVRLKNINFTVDQAGSHYKVECFPYNHIALSDQVNKIFNDVRLQGKTATEVLSDEDNEFSLVSFLNSREKQLVEDDKKTYPDVYKIEFVGDNPFGSAPGNDLEFKPDSQGGMAIAKRAGDVVDGDKVQRGQMSINPKEKTLQFDQGMSITNIIDAVVLSTKEARENATDPGKLDSAGRVTWWKQDVHVELIEPVDPKTKDYPKMITFRINVFKVHHSMYLHPEGSSRGVDVCKSLAAKVYNYIYTGKNTDILKFDINIKNMMFTAVDPSKHEYTATQASAGVNRRVASSPEKSEQEPGAAEPSQGGNAIAAKVDLRAGNLPFKGGSGDITTSQKIANEFYTAYLNSVGNQINLDMEIIGDPDFLPENGNCNLTVEGDDTFGGPNGCINTDGTDIFIVVNWRTPADPDPGGAAGKKGGFFFFPENGAPNPFSGVWKLTKVENSFRNNFFSQKLIGYRMPAQDITGGPVFVTQRGEEKKDTGEIFNFTGNWTDF
jgi:hypothetical protein